METKELVMNKTTKSTDKIKTIFTELNNREGKKLVDTVNNMVNWFDLFSRDSNRWEFAKQTKINDNVTVYCTMRNCEDLYNYRQFEPEIVITIEYNGNDIRTYGSGTEGGCLDEEIYEFQNIIKTIYKEVKHSRNIFRKNVIDPEDDI